LNGEDKKMNLYGGIEAGGTKFVCMVGGGPDEILAEIRFPTNSPDETIGKAIQFFKEQTIETPIKGIGIGSFGPVDLDTASPSYGYITSTPKPGWAQTDFVGRIQNALNIPVSFDTDVNAAALGEFKWGNAGAYEPFLYFTIGTGIGGGGFINGGPLHGLVHPEMGHIMLPHNPDADPFPGSCPYHGDCFEGLASGGAIEKRWGIRAENLPDDHPAWELEANYLALAMMNIICTLSPRKIVLGGGVMHKEILLTLVHRKVGEMLNGYVQSPAILREIDTFIVRPSLGNRSGVLGAIALAQRF
jgi:fructokinase